MTNYPTIQYYRIFNIKTDETLEYIKAQNEMEASYKVGKIYGPNNELIDFEIAPWVTKVK